MGSDKQDRAAGEAESNACSSRFFDGFDWLAFAVCFAVAFAVYFYTQAPTVTLEDSGELAVASNYFGVPHPPGYPLWTLLTWMFQLCFHWVRYNGYPNPAWAVGLSSGFFGALACGLLALLISRSGHELLRTAPDLKSNLSALKTRILCMSAGVSSGLLLAFSPVLWSQSTIVEVYSLNALFLVLVVLYLYMWMSRPTEFKWLYAMAFSFGLGLTNHQSLMFMGPSVVLAVMLNEVRWSRAIILSLIAGALALGGIATPFPWLFFAAAIGTCLFIKSAPLYRDFMIGGLVMLVLVYTSSWMGAHEHLQLNWSEGPANPGFWMWTVLAVAFPALIALPREWRRTLAYALLMLATLYIARLWLHGYAPEEQSLPAGARGARALWPWYAAGFLAIIPALTGRRIRICGLATIFAAFIVVVQMWAKREGIDDLTISGGIMATGLWLFVFTSFAFWTLMFIDMPKGGIVGSTFLLIILGLSFYLIMPIASEQNPPMNWGYARTWSGFMHSVTRGQYETIDPILNFRKIVANPIFFMKQNFEIIFNPSGCISLVSQFTLPIAALALMPFILLQALAVPMRKWIAVAAVALISMTTVFVVFQYPSLDLQTLFIGRVQYVQAHAIFALLIGYGFILAINAGAHRLRRQPWLVPSAIFLMCLLPAIPLLRNRYDRELLAMSGSASHRDHDFGWQFGYYQLRGAAGILAELAPEERDAYPNPDYPPAMGPNAILFGGTDPGRFVPTYMVFSANVRPDVFVITQNALADETYLKSLRNLYGNDIWIPSAADMNEAFHLYIRSVERGMHQADGSVDFTGESVSIQGVSSIMQVNSNLARMIHLANRFTQSADIVEMFDRGVDLNSVGVRTAKVGDRVLPVREFYVEESYVIPWMYPYLEPHGLIMRLNPRRTELTDEMVKNDQAFWAWYTERLLNNRHFARDIVAQKTFSKLRSAIAGLYVHHEKYDEALTAFKQAAMLNPKSPEASLRMADTYMRQDRWEEAKQTVRNFIALDPADERGHQFLSTLKEVEELNQYRAMLERRFEAAGDDISLTDAVNLARAYLALNDHNRFEQLTKTVLENEVVPPEAYLTFANLAGQAGDGNLFEAAVSRYTERRPDDFEAWINLAAIRSARENISEALEAVAQAVAVGGDNARRAIMSDPRLRLLQNHERFRDLLGLENLDF